MGMFDIKEKKDDSAIVNTTCKEELQEEYDKVKVSVGAN